MSSPPNTSNNSSPEALIHKAEAVELFLKTQAKHKEIMDQVLNNFSNELNKLSIELQPLIEGTRDLLIRKTNYTKVYEQASKIQLHLDLIDEAKPVVKTGLEASTLYYNTVKKILQAHKSISTLLDRAISGATLGEFSSLLQQVSVQILTLVHSIKTKSMFQELSGLKTFGTKEAQTTLLLEALKTMSKLGDLRENNEGLTQPRLIITLIRRIVGQESYQNPYLRKLVGYVTELQNQLDNANSTGSRPEGTIANPLTATFKSGMDKQEMRRARTIEHLERSIIEIFYYTHSFRLDHSSLSNLTVASRLLLPLPEAFKEMWVGVYLPKRSEALVKRLKDINALKLIFKEDENGNIGESGEDGMIGSIPPIDTSKEQELYYSMPVTKILLDSFSEELTRLYKLPVKDMREGVVSSDKKPEWPKRDSKSSVSPTVASLAASKFPQDSPILPQISSIISLSEQAYKSIPENYSFTLQGNLVSEFLRSIITLGIAERTSMLVALNGAYLSPNHVTTKIPLPGAFIPTSTESGERGGMHFKGPQSKSGAHSPQQQLSDEEVEIQSELQILGNMGFLTIFTPFYSRVLSLVVSTIPIIKKLGTDAILLACDIIGELVNDRGLFEWLIAGTCGTAYNRSPEALNSQTPRYLVVQRVRSHCMYTYNRVILAMEQCGKELLSRINSFYTEDKMKTFLKSCTVHEATYLVMKQLSSLLDYSMQINRLIRFAVDEEKKQGINKTRQFEEGMLLEKTVAEIAENEMYSTDTANYYFNFCGLLSMKYLSLLAEESRSTFSSYKHMVFMINNKMYVLETLTEISKKASSQMSALGSICQRLEVEIGKDINTFGDEMWGSVAKILDVNKIIRMKRRAESKWNDGNVDISDGLSTGTRDNSDGTQSEYSTASGASSVTDFASALEHKDRRLKKELYAVMPKFAGKVHELVKKQRKLSIPNSGIRTQIQNTVIEVVGDALQEYLAQTTSNLYSQKVIESMEKKKDQKLFISYNDLITLLKGAFHE